jgi:hypothetical protein
MRTTLAFGLTALLAVTALPSFAADSMMMAPSNHSMMMKSGEAMMVMPSGQTMMMAPMKGPMDPAMMKAAAPLDKCMIFMMGKDGKMYMTDDMKMKDGKMACEEMSMMKH